MIQGAGKAGYLVVGGGWMLWDFNWFRKRNADELVPRLADHASPGDIIVIHDGHHENPRSDRRYAIETVDRLIPKLREKGSSYFQLPTSKHPVTLGVGNWELGIDDRQGRAKT